MPRVSRPTVPGPLITASEMSDFEIHLPAIRGIQAGRPFYLALCPTKFIPRLIPQDLAESSEGSPFNRAADRGRSQDIARYLASNPQSYVLPAITCLIDGEVQFDEPGEKGHSFGHGTLRVPLTSRILILDGTNRRAGIEMALKLRPELGDEAIPILFYVDSSPKRVEQILSDIRRNGSRSARSQGILCDLRDETAVITKELVSRVDVFTDMTETVRSTISNRSLKLFTFSAIYHANEILLSGRQKEPYAKPPGSRIGILDGGIQAHPRLAACQGEGGEPRGTPEVPDPRSCHRPCRSGQGREIGHQ